MRRTMSLACAVVLAVAVAACGDAATTTTTSATTTSVPAATATESPASSITTTAPPTTEPPQIVAQSDAGTIQLEAPAERIAALSATHVEMLYAIGAGPQVIAGDLFTNHPPATETLTKIDSFNLNVEAVIDLDPDLVVLSFDPGEAVAAFEAVGIPTLLYVGAATLDDVWLQFGELGKATGRAAEAEAVVAEMQDKVAAIVADVGDVAAGVTYYHETDPFSFYTPNSSSFVGQLYALLGLENIADAAPDEFTTGYPQLSPEYIIEADPDVIFLGAFGETPETVAGRDGWATMSAVAEDRMFPVDVDESSRWGPRIVDFLEEVANIVVTMEVVEG